MDKNSFQILIFGSIPWVMVDIVIRPTNKSTSSGFSVTFTQQLPMNMDILDNTIHSSHNYTYIRGNATELVVNSDVVDLESSIHVLYYASVLPNDVMSSINNTLRYQSLSPQDVTLQVQKHNELCLYFSLNSIQSLKERCILLYKVTV